MFCKLSKWVHTKIIILKTRLRTISNMYSDGNSFCLMCIWHISSFDVIRQKHTKQNKNTKTRRNFIWIQIKYAASSSFENFIFLCVEIIIMFLPRLDMSLIFWYRCVTDSCPMWNYAIKRCAFNSLQGHRGIPQVSDRCDNGFKTIVVCIET